jgi:YVTN family beta-propeller protein
MKRASLFFAPLCLTFALGAWAAAPSYKVVDKITLGGDARWDFIYADGSQHRLYVSHGGQTEVVDTQTDKPVGTISGTAGVHGIAVADDLGLGYTSNGRDNSVTVFDLATLKQRATIKVGENPDAILYDPATQRLITFNGRSKDATIIDAKRGEVVGTVALGGKPEVADIGKDGAIYLNIEDTSEVVVIDPKTAKLTQRHSIKPCDSPTGLAVDTQKRVYSVCDNKLLVVTSPEGKLLGQAPIGAGPDGVVWLDGYAFASNGKDGTISVVGESSAGKFETVATIATEPGARTITADSSTHKLYLPTADFKIGSDGKRQGVPGSFRVLVVDRQ